MDTVLKRERSKRKTLTQAKLLELLASKEVVGLAGTCAAVYIIPRIRWNPDDAANSATVGLLTAVSILVALGQAGVGDNTTLALATALGISESWGSLSSSEKWAIVGTAGGVSALAFLSGFLPALGAL